MEKAAWEGEKEVGARVGAGATLEEDEEVEGAGLEERETSKEWECTKCIHTCKHRKEQGKDCIRAGLDVRCNALEGKGHSPALTQT